MNQQRKRHAASIIITRIEIDDKLRGHPELN